MLSVSTATPSKCVTVCVNEDESNFKMKQQSMLPIHQMLVLALFILIFK